MRGVVPKILCLAACAFAAVYLVAHIAAAGFGLPTFTAALAAAVVSLYVAAMLYAEARR